MTKTLEEARSNILAARQSGDAVGSLLSTPANDFRMSLRASLRNSRKDRIPGYTGTGGVVPTGNTTSATEDTQAQQDAAEPTGRDLTDNATDPIADQITNDRITYMNEFIRNQYPNVPAGTSLGNFFDSEKFSKWLISKIGGAAASALLGGGVGGLLAGNRAGSWLRNWMGNYNWWGPDQGIMSPNSPDFVNPQTGQQGAPPQQGIIAPDSDSFVEPGGVDTSPWIGREATNSRWAAQRGSGTGSITGSGKYWYATRLSH